MNTFDMIYEDDAVIVCYKPAGVATQTRRLGQQDMESLLKNYRAKRKEPPYIGIVHRLDQPVEGVMVFAKTQKAAAELSKQVQNRSIGKKYYAIGQAKTKQACTTEYITLTDYLTFDARKNVGTIVTQEDVKAGHTKDAKKAVLAYKICGVHENHVLLDICLQTGRHHQIRLQMANAGYPLVGDQKYGESRESIQLALCSYFLEFVHPVTKKKMAFSIEPKNDLFQIFEGGRVMRTSDFGA